LKIGYVTSFLVCFQTIVLTIFESQRRIFVLLSPIETATSQATDDSFPVRLKDVIEKAKSGNSQEALNFINSHPELARTGIKTLETAEIVEDDKITFARLVLESEFYTEVVVDDALYVECADFLHSRFSNSAVFGRQQQTTEKHCDLTGNTKLDTELGIFQKIRTFFCNSPGAIDKELAEFNINPEIGRLFAKVFLRDESLHYVVLHYKIFDVLLNHFSLQPVSEFNIWKYSNIVTKYLSAEQISQLVLRSDAAIESFLAAEDLLPKLSPLCLNILAFRCLERIENYPNSESLLALISKIVKCDEDSTDPKLIPLVKMLLNNYAQYPLSKMQSNFPFLMQPLENSSIYSLSLSEPFIYFNNIDDYKRTLAILETHDRFESIKTLISATPICIINNVDYPKIIRPSSANVDKIPEVEPPAGNANPNRFFGKRLSAGNTSNTGKRKSSATRLSVGHRIVPVGSEDNLLDAEKMVAAIPDAQLSAVAEKAKLPEDTAAKEPQVDHGIDTKGKEEIPDTAAKQRNDGKKEEDDRCCLCSVM
jgi:hypothetical protein